MYSGGISGARTSVARSMSTQSRHGAFIRSRSGLSAQIHEWVIQYRRAPSLIQKPAAAKSSSLA